MTGQALDAGTLPELHRLTRMSAFGWASGLKPLLLFAHRAEIADG